jgi:hypothetical protein
MRQYEQDWMELGFRVAKAMHYQARWARSYLEQAAIAAEAAAEQEQRCSVEPRGGMHMPDITTAIVGNLTDDPEVRYTQDGIARAVFRVAVSGRREQEASFFTVIVWRDQAEHAAQSLSRAAGSWSWAGSSSGPGPLRMATPDRWSRSLPRSSGRACGGATATTTRTTRSQAR